MVERVLIRPPSARVGPATPAERHAAMAASALSGRYDKTIDRASAYEELARRAQPAAPPEPARPGPWSEREPAQRQREDRDPTPRRASRSDSVTTAMTKSVVRSVGSAIGRELVRGILGSLRRSRR
jgi:DNA helicase HerA-like ATPase